MKHRLLFGVCIMILFSLGSCGSENESMEEGERSTVVTENSRDETMEPIQEEKPGENVLQTNKESEIPPENESPIAGIDNGHSEAVETKHENALEEHGFSSEGLPSGTDGAGSQVAEEDKPSGMEDMYKAILLGEEDFVAIDFRDGDRSVNIENIIEVVSDEDVAAEVTKFAIIDLDGNGENELVLWIQWLGDRVFGYEILFYQDQEVYGFTLPDRGFVNPKADGTFDYLGGIDHSGTGRLQFTEKGYKIEDVSDSESQVSKPDLGWYDLTPESVELAFEN